MATSTSPSPRDRTNHPRRCSSRRSSTSVVNFLAEIAGGGRALELGIGAGRIALPLAERGVPVHGIELSRALAAQLRAKPGGERVGVTIGDFATTYVEGSFSLAYLVFNTIMNLTTQAVQRVLSRRGGVARAGWVLRDRGHAPRAAAAPAW
jgi:16S rRNA A1518/A1519 N6-dimethyltransferase RsmA/KsgA/DIM1 with predicted DNA glycosylase/AP lyase activity